MSDERNPFLVTLDGYLVINGRQYEINFDPKRSSLVSREFLPTNPTLHEVAIVQGVIYQYFDNGATLDWHPLDGGGGAPGPDSVGPTELQDDAVGNNHMQDNAIGELELQDGAVTNPKLAPNAVTTDKIQDNTISWGDLDSALQSIINSSGGGSGYITAPTRNLFVDKTYAEVFKSYTLAVGTDDGYVDTNTSTFDNSSITLSFDEDHHLFLRFNLDIPQGVRITSARIRFHCPVNTSIQDFEVLVGIEDTDDALTIVDYADYASRSLVSTVMTSWRGIDSALLPGVGLGFMATKAGLSIISSELFQLVNYTVNRPGWISGNAIQFVLDVQSINNELLVSSFESAHPPELIVTYEDPVARSTADGSRSLPFVRIQDAINQIITNADNDFFVYNIEVLEPGIYNEDLTLNHYNLKNINFISRGKTTVGTSTGTDSLNSTANNEYMVGLSFEEFVFVGNVNITCSVGNLVPFQGLFFRRCSVLAGSITISNAFLVGISECDTLSGTLNVTNVAVCYIDGGLISGLMAQLNIAHDPGQPFPNSILGGTFGSSLFFLKNVNHVYETVNLTGDELLFCFMGQAMFCGTMNVNGSFCYLSSGQLWTSINATNSAGFYIGNVGLTTNITGDGTHTISKAVSPKYFDFQNSVIYCGMGDGSDMTIPHNQPTTPTMVIPVIYDTHGISDWELRQWQQADQTNIYIHATSGIEFQAALF